MVFSFVFCTDRVRGSSSPDHLPPFDGESEGYYVVSSLKEGWGFELESRKGSPSKPLLQADAAGDGLMTTAHHQGRLAGSIVYHWDRKSHLVHIHELRTLPGMEGHLGPLLLEQVLNYALKLAARGVQMEAFTRQTRTIDLCLGAGFGLWAIEGGPDLQRARIRLGKHNKRAIPTRSLCHRLLWAYRLAPGIIEHSMLTERVASLLARDLQEQGVVLNPELVMAGALLHDIGKGVDPGQHHLASRHIVEEEGFPRLGTIVEKHLATLILTPHAPTSWEEKLVCYADKVCTLEIVSLTERFQDLGRRYRKQAQAIQRALPPFLELQEEIFSHLPWSPQELPGRAGCESEQE